MAEYDDRAEAIPGPDATKERSMSSTPADHETAFPSLPLPRDVPAAAGPKSPVLALVLSLFPGIGQIYNGQPAKALVFFFAWAGSIYLTAEASPFFAFVIIFSAIGRSAFAFASVVIRPSAAINDATRFPIIAFWWAAPLPNRRPFFGVAGTAG